MGIRTSDIGNPLDILITEVIDSTEAVDSDARSDMIDTLNAAMGKLTSDCDLYDAIEATRTNALAETNALGALKQVAKAQGITKFLSWVENSAVDDQRQLVTATLNAIAA